jgi:hypothetical protein
MKLRLLPGLLLLALLTPLSTASAQEALPFDQAVFGNIAADIETVDFLLNGNAGQTYQVDIMPVEAAFAPQFTLLQEDASLGVWYVLNAGETLSARMRFEVTSTYRIRVAAGSVGADTGAFSITVSAASDPALCLAQAGTTPLGGTHIIIMPIGDMQMLETQVISGIPQVIGLQTGDATCNGTMASLLLMQSSDGTPARARVDGALIEFNSVIALRANDSVDAFASRPGNNPPVLHLIVLDGTATVAEQEVEAGFTIMSAADSDSGERLQWVGERPLNDEELMQLQPLTDIDIPLPR